MCRGMGAGWDKGNNSQDYPANMVDLTSSPWSKLDAIEPHNVMEFC